MPRNFCEPVIINMLLRADHLTAEQMFLRTDYSMNVLRNCLRRMEKKGLVIKIGVTGKGKILWKLLKKGIK